MNPSNSNVEIRFLLDVFPRITWQRCRSFEEEAVGELVFVLSDEARHAGIERPSCHLHHHRPEVSTRRLLKGNYTMICKRCKLLNPGPLYYRPGARHRFAERPYITFNSSSYTGASLEVANTPVSSLIK